MANLNARPVAIPGYDPQGPLMAPLASVARPTGEADTAAAAVASKLADTAGEWADTRAKAEGEAEGKVAAMDPNWRPSKIGTLRAAAADAAGATVYTSNLTADFTSKAMDLFQANKDNPVAFDAGFRQLRQDYETQHAYPEIAGAFRAQTTSLESTLRLKVLSNFQDSENDRQRAQLITNQSTRNYNNQRLLAAAPEDPEAEKAVYAARDQNIADINANVESGAIAADKAAQLVQQEKDKAVAQIATARANALTTPEQVQAYRAKVKADFVAGKMKDFTGYDDLDAQLATIGRAKQTAQTTALNALNGRIDNFLTRFGKGDTPSAADLMALDAAGDAAGPQGRQAVATARAKLKDAIQIGSLPIDQAEAFVRQREQQARAGARPPVPMSAAERDLVIRTAYGEAAGEPDAGVAGVVSTIKNRVLDGNYGGRSIEGVVLNPKQYSLWNAGDPAGAKARALAKDDPQYARIGSIVDAVMSGATPSPIGGQMHYYNPASAAPDWGPALAAQGETIIGNHRFVGPKGGVDTISSDVLTYDRALLEARRGLVAQDPLLAANREGLVPQISTVDFTAAPADVASQMRDRVNQARAVGDAYSRAPQFIRPDEKPVIDGVLKQGGDKALDLLDGVIQGAGPHTPDVLRELGGDAPELAHAALVMQATGDRTFARQVANAIRARNTPGGAKPVGPAADDVQLAMHDVLGQSLQGLDPQERLRTQAAAVAWSEQEFLRRNVDPKSADARPIVEEAIRRARGMTGTGKDTFGGIADAPYGGSGLFGRAASPVQVPADVKTSAFGDVLNAIADDDLKGLANPPVDKAGKVLSADQLRRSLPIWGPGGYRFGTPDPNGALVPLIGRDGNPFVLPWAQIAPVLRQRKPAAFRG